MSKNRQKRRREERALGKMAVKDPSRLLGFNIDRIPVVVQSPSEPALTPEEQELTRMYSTIADNVWRLHRKVFDEDGEPEAGMKGIAKFVEKIEDSLKEARIEIVDFDGKAYDEGDAVKVIAFEDRNDLKHAEVTETLRPTVRWTDASGRVRILKQAEVIVGRPPAGN